MPCYVCTGCGAQYAETQNLPGRCSICEDERQYVTWEGQAWTTLDDLKQDHRSVVKEEAPGLTGIGIEPRFAIGQRALLVRTSSGNVLWDCIPLLDDGAVSAVRARGGLSGIAISHPHFYSSMVEWSRAFDGVPIYVHAADRGWVARPDPPIVFWEGDTHRVFEGLTLIHCGGHFEGSAVLHWAAGAEGRGVLLSGDTLQVVFDRRHVSFMYSYPNLIPLGAPAVRRIVEAVARSPSTGSTGAGSTGSSPEMPRRRWRARQPGTYMPSELQKGERHSPTACKVTER